MISDKERRRAVAELREASTGAYRHADSLDVIANSVGVEVAGKLSYEVENETFQRALARLTESPGTDRRSVMGHIADLIERGACRNVYDDMAYGSCDNGFLCSACGCKVEDEEHYRVSGVWNYCPQCGRKVRHG